MFSVNMFVLLFSFSGLTIVTIFWISLCLYARALRKENVIRRQPVLKQLGVTSTENRKIIGFFHPYCNAGGGGERVLWTAIADLQRKEPNVVSAVYSGDIDATKEQILAKVVARFNISLDPSKVHFVFLHSRKWVEDSQWPHFTLLGQSLGSMYLAWEAMTKLIPDLYIDTMGYAFTFHVVLILGRIPVGAYVHYPTISTDMLTRVRNRTNWHTNSDAISSSAFLSDIKLVYYRLFMFYYSATLRRAAFVMVNSSWTKNHVDGILQHSDIIFDLLHVTPPVALLRLLYLFMFWDYSTSRKSHIVYPPCDTHEMVQFPLENRKRMILSIAQFRPEKDHPTQLRALSQLLTKYPQYKEKAGSKDAVRLVLIGGSRNKEDATRVDQLQALARELGVDEHVEFIVNAPYSVVLDHLSKASIGLSTMVDEHFGINVVEFMAAGVIPVTHASGGPFKDIVVPFNGKPTGFHAKSAEEFADAINEALSLSGEEELALRTRARTWAVKRFSEEEFEKGWNEGDWRELLFE